jgi:hypothetical protein
MRGIALTLTILATLLVAGCGAPAASTSPDLAALVQAKCTRCHPVSRIKSAQHDAAGWAATIARMQSKGAMVDDAQAAAIATFLANGGAEKL